MTELSDAWEKLHAHSEDEQGFVRLRLSSVGACATYAARRISNGLEALILEVSTASLPKLIAYPHSVGFEIIGEPLEPGRSGRTRLLLSLTNARFQDIFQPLCTDVVRHLSTAINETEAVRTFISRLVRWQAFLRRYDPAGLSLEERRGLYGELTFLSNLLSHGLPSHEAVHAWKGSKGANHDFQLPSGSVEIKATSANTPHSIHISNVGQLDEQGVNALFLLLITLDENEGGESSLPELIHLIRSKLEGIAADDFEESLIDARYLDLHAEIYSSPRYTIRSKRFFRVLDGFPRLLANALPSGVEDVRYSVAVAACVAFECSEQQMLELTLTKPLPLDD